MYADQLMIHDNGKYKKGTIVRITDKRRVFRIILSLFPTHVGVILWKKNGYRNIKALLKLYE